jgi:hypothetical protein
LSHNSRHFVTQDKMVGTYDSTAWYHLNLILNTGYRDTMPSHFIYTLNYIENLHLQSGESQSYRFWATMAKIRQLQTNGRYGLEDGLDLRTAQPRYYYSDLRGKKSLRSDVGDALWRNLMTAFIDDFVADANKATANDWDQASNNSSVQARVSQDFSATPNTGFIFDRGPIQGLNTYRLIPLLQEQGVRDATIQRLIDWSETTWPRGPWADLR